MAREFKIPSHMIRGLLNQLSSLKEDYGEKRWMATPLGILHSLLFQDGATTKKTGAAKDSALNRKSIADKFRGKRRPGAAD
jgi:hypothetical protein